LPPDEGPSRRATLVRDLHAAGIVEQHGDDILLIHGGTHDERRTEEAEQDEAKRGDAKRRQNDAIAQPAIPDPHPTVREDGDNHHGGNNDRGDKRGGRDVEAELALPKYHRPIREKRLE